jgi:hypothetical protein
MDTVKKEFEWKKNYRLRNPYFGNGKENEGGKESLWKTFYHDPKTLFSSNEMNEEKKKISLTKDKSFPFLLLSFYKVALSLSYFPIKGKDMMTNFYIYRVVFDFWRVFLT